MFGDDRVRREVEQLEGGNGVATCGEGMVQYRMAEPME